MQIDDASGLPTITTDSDVAADDTVVVIGNALGRGGEPTATAGTVVALGQQITATDETGSRAETLTDMIQIEAEVQPGQSGGAVVDADGEVVGMTTAASTSGGYRFGFEDSSGREAFAIPIDRALSVVDEIRGGKSTDSVHVGPRAILGVEIQQQLVTPNGRRLPLDDSTAVSDVGVKVSGVSEDGPAANAGIREGSVIVTVDGVAVTSADDVTLAMNKLSPDDEIEVTWIDESGNRRTRGRAARRGPASLTRRPVQPVAESARSVHTARTTTRGRLAGCTAGGREPRGCCSRSRSWRRPPRACRPKAPPGSRCCATSRSSTWARVDRVTFVFDNGTPEVLEATYFSGPAVENPSGELLQPPLLGVARFRITMSNASGVDLSVDPFVDTYLGPDRIQPGLPTVVDLALTEDFEATLQWTIGLSDGEVPATVQVLSGPTRVVIDFPHGAAAAPVAGRPIFTG